MQNPPKKLHDSWTMWLREKRKRRFILLKYLAYKICNLTLQKNKVLLGTPDLFFGYLIGDSVIRDISFSPLLSFM